MNSNPLLLRPSLNETHEDKILLNCIQITNFIAFKYLFLLKKKVKNVETSFFSLNGLQSLILSPLIDFL